MNNFYTNSKKYFRMIFRIILTGIIAFVTSGCPDHRSIKPLYGVEAPLYGVPSVLENNTYEYPDLNDKNSQ